jgi:hypothetical protein
MAKNIVPSLILAISAVLVMAIWLKLKSGNSSKATMQKKAYFNFIRVKVWISEVKIAENLKERVVAMMKAKNGVASNLRKKLFLE